MNETLTIYAREQLKEGLAKCTDGNILLFKRMYSHENLELPISEVVDNMPDEKLDWAMRQVERTLIKNKKNG